MAAMKRTILLLSVLLAMAGTAPASAALLGENSPPGKSFLNTSIEQVAGDVNREMPPGSGGAWLEGAAEFSVAPATVRQGYSRAYRAVSEAEYQDILRTGQFRQGPNSLEGKWFADSLEGAQGHARNLFPDGKFRLIEADLPNNAPSLFRQPNLDGLGPARYLHLDDLNGVTPRPVR